MRISRTRLTGGLSGRRITQPPDSRPCLAGGRAQDSRRTRVSSASPRRVAGGVLCGHAAADAAFPDVGVELDEALRGVTGAEVVAPSPEDRVEIDDDIAQVRVAPGTSESTASRAVGCAASNAATASAGGSRACAPSSPRSGRSVACAGDSPGSQTLLDHRKARPAWSCPDAAQVRDDPGSPGFASRPARMPISCGTSPRNRPRSAPAFPGGRCGASTEDRARAGRCLTATARSRHLRGSHPGRMDLAVFHHSRLEHCRSSLSIRRSETRRATSRISFSWSIDPK
jgi:hypothetical protein